MLLRMIYHQKLNIKAKTLNFRKIYYYTIIFIITFIADF